jgi:hypothetical protein
MVEAESRSSLGEGLGMAKKVSDVVSAGSAFDVRFLEKGKHSVILFLPQEYHASIGLVVAYWGNLETVFNKCLDAILVAEAAAGGSRDTTGWRRLNFKRRRRLLKGVCEEWVAPRRPEAAKELGEISDRAGDLMSKRNMIAHGMYSYTIPPGSSLATNCRAIDSETGEEMPFDADILKKLYHDISHLTAELQITFQKFGTIQGAAHTFPDTELLRVYRETIHPWNPNPRKRPPPP